MSTTKQLQAKLQANRENSLKSTGPKTIEGKAVVARNALKHGILSKEVLLMGENKKSLEELTQTLYEELNPLTALEVLLVDRIISNTWRLRRLLEVERNAMEWQKEYIDPVLEIDLSFGVSQENKEQQKERKNIANMVTNSKIMEILRYETAIERSIYRALHELQRLQAARLGEKPPLPMVVDVTIDKEYDESGI